MILLLMLMLLLLFSKLLNAAVSVLLGGHGSHSHKPDEKEVHSHDSDKKKKSDTKNSPSTKRETVTHDLVKSNGIRPCCCATNDPAGQLERLNQMADVLNEELSGKSACGQGDVGSLSVAQGSHIHDPEAKDALDDNDRDSGNDSDDDKNKEKVDDDEKYGDTDEEQKRLVRMGVNTALAIALHNFPEGLATFVAAIDDPRVGSVLALAIAIHNIPEGLCVALPIYYATGNRRNAFMWAVLSGASELLAALLGWAVLASVFSDNLYGVIFGMVAGMMVVISIRELVPTAHFYDPDDTVVTYSFIAGMILIAFSMVLFLL
jgi:zinc transporter ZupT